MDKIRRSPILSLPVEIILQIIFNLDNFSEVLSFSSTCRQLYDVCNANSGALLYPVALKTIVAFEDGLVAIRVTELAKEQLKQMKESNGQVEVKQINLRELSAKHSLLTQSELSKVMNLQHLVDCCINFGTVPNFKNSGRLQWMQSYSFDLDNGSWFTWYGHTERRLSERMRFAVRRLYSSIYRFFIAGACFAARYMEPFLTTDHLGKQLLERYIDIDAVSVRYEPFQTKFNGEVISPDFVKYLKQFPIYNIREQSAETMEEIFGSFFDFMVDRSKEEYLVEKSMGLKFSEESFQINESLTLLSSTEFMKSIFLNANGKSRLWRFGLGDYEERIKEEKALQEGNGNYEKPPPEDEAVLMSKYIPDLEGRIKLTVFFFGVFQPEVVSIPKSAKETDNMLLITDNDKNYLGGTVDLPSILDGLHLLTGSQDWQENFYPKGPPYCINMLVYAFRKFGHRFWSDNWDEKRNGKDVDAIRYPDWISEGKCYYEAESPDNVFWSVITNSLEGASEDESDEDDESSDGEDGDDEGSNDEDDNGVDSDIKNQDDDGDAITANLEAQNSTTQSNTNVALNHDNLDVGNGNFENIEANSYDFRKVYVVSGPDDPYTDRFSNEEYIRFFGVDALNDQPWTQVIEGENKAARSRRVYLKYERNRI